jgi:hypothetical protein
MTGGQMAHGDIGWEVPVPARVVVHDALRPAKLKLADIADDHDLRLRAIRPSAAPASGMR